MKYIIFVVALFYSALSFAGPVNINAASAATLAEELDGVGPVTAQRIVAYRKDHGAFKSAEELKKVKGVGEKTFAKNKANILLK
ncbi:helix-hairpin-helix domain-containing protein [uncultured Abyssibacter sp.]|uniref:ComEA family DNA-binding protein n=1 Tax=uncultured Abyssibacter sp. TaxID=2320202 RepID=UPI0032B1DC7F